MKRQDAHLRRQWGVYAVVFTALLLTDGTVYSQDGFDPKPVEAAQNYTIITKLPATIENLKRSVAQASKGPGSFAIIAVAVEALSGKLTKEEMANVIDPVVAENGDRPNVLYRCAMSLRVSDQEKASQLYQRVLSTDTARLNLRLLSANSLVRIKVPMGYSKGISLIPKGLRESAQSTTDLTMSLLKDMKDREGQTVEGVAINLAPLRAAAAAAHKVDRTEQPDAH